MMTLPTPSIQYFLLCPTLIVFGVAVAGVLAEAFLPRRIRYTAQVTLALGGLVAALFAVIEVAESSRPPGGPRCWAPWPSTARRCTCRAPCCWSR